MKRNKIILALVAIILMACCSDRILINVAFEALFGIEKGDRVVFQGNKAGHVTGVQFNQDGKYTVQVEMDKGFANAVTEYSKFHIIDDTGQKGRKAIEVKLEREGGTPLASGSSVIGVPPDMGLAGRLQKELDAGLGFFKKQIDRFGQDLQSFPDSQGYKDLKKTLEDLASEIERKEKQTRESLKREWLPKIQRELEDLREQLKQMGREDELAPLVQEVERIEKM
jgi:paraquat-inducible protein B